MIRKVYLNIATKPATRIRGVIFVFSLCASHFLIGELWGNVGTTLNSRRLLFWTMPDYGWIPIETVNSSWPVFNWPNNFMIQRSQSYLGKTSQFTFQLPNRRANLRTWNNDFSTLCFMFLLFDSSKNNSQGYNRPFSTRPSISDGEMRYLCGENSHTVGATRQEVIVPLGLQKYGDLGFSF